MRTKGFLARLSESITKLRPFLGAFSFSPWLVLLYIIISAYAENFTLGDRQIIQSFIEWFGTAYSLFLTLVLVNVWNQFNVTDHEFDREADALATLYETINYTQAVNENREADLVSIRKVIENEIEEYLRHVIVNYRSEHLILQQRRKGDEILERIGASISSLASGGIIIEALSAELFRNLNEARDGRGDRISHSKLRIPQILWLVALISSLVWLLPFFALNIANPTVKWFLIGGAAFVIIIFLVIIRDFDNPFDGIWKVSIDDWREFLEIFDPNPQIIFVFQHNDSLDDLLSRTPIAKRIRLNKCKLSTFSREEFGLPWARFIRGVQRYHPNKIKESKCDLFYLDDYVRQSFDRNLRIEPLPVVLLRAGNEPETLIENQEIMQCHNVHEFVELFHKKIKEKIPEFQSWSDRPQK